MISSDIYSLGNPEKHQLEAYPMVMSVLRAFRTTENYQNEVINKLFLGSDKMLDLGNLYTAALPAWIAAGFEQALNDNLLEAGEEVLTLGYGSGVKTHFLIKPDKLELNWGCDNLCQGLLEVERWAQVRDN